MGAATLSPLFSSPTSASTSINGLRAEARAIAGRIDTLQVRIQILGEEYDRAAAREAALRTSIGADVLALRDSERAVAANGRALRQQAVEAYVSGGAAAGGLTSLLSSSASSLPLKQAYLAAASSSLAEAVSGLEDSEHRLGVHKLVLAKHESEAAAAASALATARSRSQRLESELAGEEAGVRGKLAAAVQAQELAELAAARAAAAAEAQAAARAAPAAAPPPAPAQGSPPQPSTSTPAAATQPATVSLGGGNGEAAVRAAESQIGVPYEWAGATPGVGFDCSGLAMWAWSQAGVALPHSAQAQYDSIEHISASQLQPGDLIFYASGGYIYHVIMYVGNGEAVQAEDTGTAIQITPVWPGAYGYGQP